MVALPQAVQARLSPYFMPEAPPYSHSRYRCNQLLPAIAPLTDGVGDCFYEEWNARYQRYRCYPDFRHVRRASSLSSA